MATDGCGITLVLSYSFGAMSGKSSLFSESLSSRSFSEASALEICEQFLGSKSAPCFSATLAAYFLGFITSANWSAY